MIVAVTLCTENKEEGVSYFNVSMARHRKLLKFNLHASSRLRKCITEIRRVYLCFSRPCRKVACDFHNALSDIACCSSTRAPLASPSTDHT